ncbi:MAG: bile acid:sodium symporter [Patescibacteria group bacterium]
MQKIIHLIEKYFSIILIIAVIVGLVWNEPFVSWKPVLAYLLAFVLFLSFLKIHVKDLVINFKKSRFMVWLLLAQMIIVPIILFYIINIWNFELALGVLIIVAIPAAVASPALIDIYKGNIALGIIVTVIEHLLVIITLPFLIFLLARTKIDLSAVDILIYMLKVVLVPFLLSIIIKEFFPKIIDKTKHYYKALTVIIISIVALVAIAVSVKYLTPSWLEIGLYILGFLGLGIIFHFIGWLIAFKQNKEDKITSVISLSYNNAALGLLIAIEFFGPMIILFCVCYEIVWNLLPFISKIFFRYIKK